MSRGRPKESKRWEDYFIAMLPSVVCNYYGPCGNKEQIDNLLEVVDYAYQVGAARQNEIYRDRMGGHTPEPVHDPVQPQLRGSDGSAHAEYADSNGNGLDDNAFEDEAGYDGPGGDYRHDGIPPEADI